MEERRKSERRQSERRTGERRQGERRQGERRQNNEKVFTERRINKDRREGTERRTGERRNGERRQGDRRKVEIKEDDDEVNSNPEYLVEGRNAVYEALKSGREINKMFVQSGERTGSINEIIKLAKNKGIVMIETEKAKLDQLSATGHHQGVIIYTCPQNYCEVEDILQIAKDKGEDPFIVILDEIEDPHNLGSIIRTCEIAGVHGIVIPKRRTALITETVEKISVGATNYLPVARVSNLNQTIEMLKKEQIWVIGADMEGETYHYDANLKGPIALVIGSEGKGMNRLVKENCDMLIKIPMFGNVSSLNASVSAGICIYEVVRQRNS